MNNKTKEWFARVILICFSISIALLFAELILRSTSFLEKNFDNVFSRVISFVVPTDIEQLGYVLKPGFHDKLIGRQNEQSNVVYSINSIGLRGDEPKNAPNRIVVLGDSMSFGLGIENEEVYTHLLQERLNSTQNPLSLGKWEVFNCSVPGYNTIQEYIFCKDLIETVEPKIIILQTFFNDLSFPMRYAMGNLVWEFEQLNPSHLLFLINVWWHKGKRAPALGPLGFAHAIEKISNLAQKMNSVFISFILPSANHLPGRKHFDLKSKVSIDFDKIERSQGAVFKLSVLENHQILFHYLNLQSDYLNMFDPFMGFPQG